MSSGQIRDVTQGIVQKIMQSPFAVLFIIAVMLWYASLMTPDQRLALRELMVDLSNPFGVGILGLIAISLIYAMVYPAFSFLAQTITNYLEAQNITYTLMKEHFEASKHMYKEMVEISRAVHNTIPKHLDCLEELMRTQKRISRGGESHVSS